MKARFFTFFTAAFLLTFAANAQTIAFLSEAGKGNKDGSDWDNAAVGSTYLNNIASGSGFSGIVYIKASVASSYNMPILRLNNGAIIKGGYPTNAIGKDTSGYNPAANPTYASTNNNYFVTAMNGSWTLKGLIINTNNYISINYTAPANSYGPYNLEDMDISNHNNNLSLIMLNNSTYLTTVNITKCYIHDNLSAATGSVVTAFGTGSGPHVVNIKRSTFVNNTSSKSTAFNSGNNGTGESQGAVFTISGGTLSIDSSSFCGNYMSASIGGGGGVIGNVYTTPSTITTNITIKNSNFSGNHCKAGGGVLSINATSGTITVTNCNFFNNYSDGNNLNSSVVPGGGALEFKNGVKSDITGCNFYGNSVANTVAGNNGANSGGAIGYFSGTHALTNCSFNLNYAAVAGGALNANGASITISGSTFKDNKTGGSSGNTGTAGSDFGRVSNTGSPGTYTIQNTSYVQLNNSAAYGSGYTLDGTTQYGNNGNSLTTTSFTCPTYAVILPVTFTGFTATLQNNAVKLNWSTATETNNTGFAVERSSDGINFTKIGFVPSMATNGNSSAVLNYTTVDESPLAGTNFYRLKQIDLDGLSAYSSIATVVIGAGKTLGLSVYPNPVSANTQLIVSGTTNFSNANIIVTNNIGQVVGKQTILQAVTMVDFSKLANGVYYIRYTDAAGNNQVAKVVK